LHSGPSFRRIHLTMVTLSVLVQCNVANPARSGRKQR